MSRARNLADYVSTGVTAAEFDFLDTTSGTPGSGNFLRGDKTWAAAGGKVVWAGWDDSHNQTGGSFIVPTLNSHLETIDTDYATIGGTNSWESGAGTLTIVKAGHYLIQFQVAQHNNASTTHILKLVVGGDQASYVVMPSSPTGWSSLNLTYANYLAVDETISFACQVGAGDPYAWVLGDYGSSAWYAGYSLAELIFLGS